MIMEAAVVCKHGKYESQGYLFWSFGFYYHCPKCGYSCNGAKYCGECGTKIEYPHKPENFELYEFNGEWRYRK
jgi:hypothetical protein